MNIKENFDSINPTTSINLNFSNYLVSREKDLSSHQIDGVPDYGFSLDQTLRQQLTAMGPVRAFTQSLVSLLVPISKQIQQMKAVAVGPKQYPEIYELGEDCSRRLGIGVPQIFVKYSPLIEGYTYATDDIAPMIVLSSGLVEAFEPEELKFVIGHECGHIHNLHGVYNTAVELITNPLAGIILHSIPGGDSLRLMLQGGMMLFFMRWSRCAEVTCDRAGLICCGDLEVAQIALAKLATGGVSRLKGINIQEFLNQIQKVQSTPVRLLELTQTHPIIPKRIEAVRLFADCDVFYSWHRELPISTPTRSKQELDELCEQFISVLNQGYQTQGR